MKSFPFMTSFWFEPGAEVSPPLDRSHSVDIAVVGGGFAGLSSALQIKQSKPDLRVALLEANHVGYGASGRNAGWLMSLPPLTWLLDNLGAPERRADIRWTAQTCRDNLTELHHLLQVAGIECDWTPTQHTLVARNPIEVATLRWIAPRFSAIGVDCAYYGQGTVGQFVGYPASAALTYDIATIQPYKLAVGLRRQLLRLGVKIYENTPVMRVEKTRQGMRLVCNREAMLLAEKVILATNAYTHGIDVGTDQPAASVYHTYMLATEPLPQDMLAQITSAGKPFGDAALAFYIGRIHNNRLLFNGIDRSSSNSPADDRHLPSYTRLYDEMLRRFPFLKSVSLAGAWGGAVQQTRTDAPIVRTTRDNPNLILNLGYGGGSGVGMALLSGKLTAGLALGDSAINIDGRRLRRLYETSRFPMLGPLRAALGVLTRLIR